MATVRINIDGREMELEQSLNLIEAARLLGIQIPHFCYHPGLGVDGNCRMCLVEIEGMPKPAIACNTTVKDLVSKDGVRKVFTTTPRVKELQKSVLEFLFLNHPLDCPICDQSGECLLQDYYMVNGQYDSRLDTAKVHKRKVVAVGPRVVLDAERCVLCTRCIRFCDSVTGTGELYIVNRGNRSEITNYPGVPLDNEYSMNTVDICPVGALTSADFRFKKRVWHLTSTQSVCPSCSRGCNIFLDHSDGLVYRYRPRENMEVNRYWMCDPGRLSYHGLNEDRLEVSLLGPAGQGEPTEIPFSQALSQAAGWFAAAREGRGNGAPAGAASAGAAPASRAGRPAGSVPGSVVFLVSPASSTETLYAVKRFAADVLQQSAGQQKTSPQATSPQATSPQATGQQATGRQATGKVSVIGMGTRPPGVEDEILRRSDPYANTAGLRLLGLEGDPEPVLSRGGDLLVVVEDDPLSPHQRPDWARHFEAFERVLYLGTNENYTSRAAHAALPIAPHSECDGTFINFQNRVQRFRKAFTPRGDALWAPELLRRCAAAFGVEFGWVNLNQLWRDLSTGEEAFRGIDVTRLGPGGMVVGTPPSEGLAEDEGSGMFAGERPAGKPASARGETDAPAVDKGALP